MNLKAILAIDEVGGIGIDGHLPWTIPEDLANFKRLTSGKRVVMGRKTLDSIAGRVLPNRDNIVLSRTGKYNVGSVLLESVDHDTWIMGGSEIYNTFHPYVDEYYITRVQGDFGCDVFFNIDYSDLVLKEQGEWLTSSTGVSYRYEVWVAKEINNG